MCCLSKASLGVSRTLSRQPYCRKVLRAQQGLWYDNSDSNHLSKIEYSNAVMTV
jgi:hypothetical protein